MKSKGLSVAAATLAAVSWSTPLFAQDNATSCLMTSGDIIGGSITFAMTDLTPSSNVYVLASLSLANPPGNFFLRDTYGTGDNNDVLAITGGPSFAAIIPGTSTAGGTFNFTAAIPGTLPLDIKVYFQGLTQHAAAGAALFQDFSNWRVATMNNSDRWQSACTDFPVPSANLGWAVKELGPNGLPKELIICGGGPALLTDENTPYPTLDEIWVYDVAQETHTVVGNLITSRAFHQVTKLNDGRFLVTGGINFDPSQVNPPFYTDVLDTAEIIDLSSGSAVVTQVTMNEHRAGNTATVITAGVHAGEVLVAGGTEGNGSNQLFDVDDLLETSLSSTEYFDPVTNSFSNGPDMQEPKAGASAVTLSDGRILVAGGITWDIIIGIVVPSFSDRANFYNPTSDTFNTEIGMRDARALFGIVELDNGNFLLAGGAGGNILSIGPISDAEVFNPNNFTFTSTANMPNAAAFPGMVALPGDRAMVVGGAIGDLDDPIPVADVNVWFNGLWTPVQDLLITHAGGVTSYLDDGTVYMGGGESGTVATIEVETYSF